MGIRQSWRGRSATMAPYAASGSPAIPQASLLSSSRILEMPLMLWENWMEEPCVAPECVLSCPRVKNAPEAADHLRLGVAGVKGAEVVIAAMTGETAVAVLPSDADHQGGGASAVVAAGLFQLQETGGEIGLFPETGTINPQDLSHAQGVAPGLMIESEIIRWARRRILFWSEGFYTVPFFLFFSFWSNHMSSTLDKIYCNGHWSMVIFSCEVSIWLSLSFPSSLNVCFSPFLFKMSANWKWSEYGLALHVLKWITGIQLYQYSSKFYLFF